MKNVSIILIFILSCLIIGSCKVFKIQTVTLDNVVLYPSPPDTVRIQYLTSINSSASVEGKQSAFKAFFFGPQEAEKIGNPISIHTSKDKIFIFDGAVKGLRIIDLKEKKFYSFIPGGAGALKSPSACFFSSDSLLYITDILRKQAVVFDAKLKYKFVKAISDTGQFKPMSIVEYDKKVWIVNGYSKKVHVYDKFTDELLYTFPNDKTREEGKLFSPAFIHANNDKIYVTDVGGFCVNVYDLDGVFIKRIGQYGNLFGQFGRPKGLAVDREEILHVVDASFENVQMFNNDGRVLMFYGGPYTASGGMTLPRDLTIDYSNVEYFSEYLLPEFKAKYLIFVTNQYGPDKINVYARVEYK